MCTGTHCRPRTIPRCHPAVPTRCRSDPVSCRRKTLMWSFSTRVPSVASLAVAPRGSCKNKFPSSQLPSHSATVRSKTSLYLLHRVSHIFLLSFIYFRTAGGGLHFSIVSVDGKYCWQSLTDFPSPILCFSPDILNATSFNKRVEFGERGLPAFPGNQITNGFLK